MLPIQRGSPPETDRTISFSPSNQPTLALSGDQKGLAVFWLLEISTHLLRRHISRCAQDPTRFG
jgi:hypothetical protein